MIKLVPLFSNPQVTLATRNATLETSKSILTVQLQILRTILGLHLGRIVLLRFYDGSVGFEDEEGLIRSFLDELN